MRSGIGTLVVLALLASGCTGSDDEAAPAVPAAREAPGVAVAGVDADDLNVEGVADLDDDVDGSLRAVTAAYDIEVDGFDGTPVVVTLPVTDTDLAAGTGVVVATAEQVDGPWELLDGEVTADGHVRFETSHFSLFQAFVRLADVTVETVAEALNAVTDDLVAEATPPGCTDEDAARRGYDVASDTSSAVYWCFGADGERRQLKLVNNRRYPMLLSYSDGLDVIGQDRLAIDLDARAARLLAGADRVSVAPGGTVEFAVDLAAGADAAAVTEFDGVAHALYQIDVAARTLTAILTKFGKNVPVPAVAQLLEATECADAFVEAAQDPGPGPTASLITTCFSFAVLASAFGLAAAIIIGVVTTAGTLLSFLASSISGAYESVTGADHYAVVVSRDAPPAAPPPPAAAAGARLTPSGIDRLVLDQAQSTAVLTSDLFSLLGTPTEDSGWVLESCTDGQQRILRYADLEVHLYGGSERAALWGWLATGPSLPAGSRIDGPIQFGMTAADVEAAGGFWSNEVMFREAGGFLGEVDHDGSTQYPPPEAPIVSIGTGTVGIGGC